MYLPSWGKQKQANGQVSADRGHNGGHAYATKAREWFASGVRGMGQKMLPRHFCDEFWRKYNIRAMEVEAKRKFVLKFPGGRGAFSLPRLPMSYSEENLHMLQCWEGKPSKLRKRWGGRWEQKPHTYNLFLPNSVLHESEWFLPTHALGEVKYPQVRILGF